MSSTRDQISPQRKTQRTKPGPLRGDDAEPGPAKRQKAGIKLHSAAFYDALSTICLTRRALRELNRGTRQDSDTEHFTPASRDVYRADSLKKLQRFARQGGPDLVDLRGYPEPANIDSHLPSMSFRDTTLPSGSKFTKSTAPTTKLSKPLRSSAYDNNFELVLIDNHIFLNGYHYPNGRQTPKPAMEGFHEMLGRTRQSLSPSCFTDSDFQEFQKANDEVVSEEKVMTDILPIIYGDTGIFSERDMVFTKLDPIASGYIVNAKPDLYDGARLADIDKKIRDDIGHFFIPTKYPAAPVLPNFFLEAKAPTGVPGIARRQACYDGALGARAMHQLQSYGEDELTYDGNAYTVSTTYHDGRLRLYTTHPTRGSEGITEYHMTQVNGWDMTGNADTFRQGAAAFRNAREWAQEKRNDFIRAANERARAVNVAHPSPEVSAHEDSDTQESQHTTQPNQTGDLQGGSLAEVPETLLTDFADELALYTCGSASAEPVYEGDMGKRYADDQ